MRDKKTGLLITPPFIASFVNVFNMEKPMPLADGTVPSPSKYSLTAIFDPSKFDSADRARMKAIEAALDEASMEKFKKPVAKLPPTAKRALRDGEEKEHLNGYGAGKVFCRMSTKNRPSVVGEDRVTPIDDPEAIYSGCVCRASVSVYAYKKGGGVGVSIGLRNVMFIKDGPRLDSRTNAEDDFGEMGNETQEDDDLT